MALSVVQCVAKRRRQLERLEFALAASARRLSAAAGTARRRPAARSMLSETAQLQISYSYAQLLLAALDMEKEQQPTAEQLFASALVLEDFADTMPRLLELREEEEHVAQRSAAVWRAIYSSSGSSRTVREVLAQCEHKWAALVTGATYLSQVVARVQELHDQRARSASCLLARTGGCSARAGDGGKFC